MKIIITVEGEHGEITRTYTGDYDMLQSQDWNEKVGDIIDSQYEYEKLT